MQARRLTGTQARRPGQVTGPHPAAGAAAGAGWLGLLIAVRCLGVEPKPGQLLASPATSKLLLVVAPRPYRRGLYLGSHAAPGSVCLPALRHPDGSQAGSTHKSLHYS